MEITDRFFTKALRFFHRQKKMLSPCYILLSTMIRGWMRILFLIWS